jgi:AraC family transcriptional regulator, transcriptional activator FtrA
MDKDLAIHRIAVLALPPVVAFDLTIATQVFGHDRHRRYQVQLCTPVPGPTLTTSGFSIVVDSGLDALSTADTVIVPGFAERPVPETALVALRAAHDRGARMASICSGAFALAEAGLLDDRRATTHWRRVEELTRDFPAVTVDPKVLYVDTGDVLTSAGLAAGLDLCLHMIANDHGEPAAVERSRDLVMPLHRAGGQAQFIARTPSDRDGTLTAVTEWAQEHLHLPITVADLAERALQAPRTFCRNFRAQLGQSPHAWLIDQRLRRACRLLENDEVGIDEVARRSGLGTAANLRLHFRRYYATTPTAYRSTFTAGRRSAIGNS